MIPKLDNSFRAIAQGVSKVIILHATNILTGRGTLLSGSVVKE
jgi:acetylglutamate kinase